MKKFFGYLIIISLFLSLFNFCDAKPRKKKKPSLKHKIEFVTKDKFILVGDLYLASEKTDKPLVVCLHSFSMNSKAWNKLASDLRLRGYNILTMDLRGHGRSVYNEDLRLKSRFYFKNDVWQKLPKDVIYSIKYVQANYPNINCNDVIMVGADIGASAGVIASMSLKKTPEKIVLISPMFEFKGLRMPLRSSKFYNTQFLMVLAKTDRLLISFDVKKPAIVKRYPLGGPGNKLIDVNKSAYDDVLNFISK